MNRDPETGGDAGAEARLRALEERVSELQRRLDDRESGGGVSLICFSGEWDRLYAAFTIASGALAMGKEVHIFFTFWSVAALRGGGRIDPECERDFSQSMLGKMLPAGPDKARLSHLHWLGLGKVMLKRLMKKQGVDDLGVLMQEVRDLGGQLHLCDTSMGLFGMSCGEMKGGEDMGRCGAATFIDIALKSKVVLFV